MSDLTSEFTAAQLQHITDYLLIEGTSLVKADLGFVFGNKYHGESLAILAADLYHRKFFPRIMVTGAPIMNGDEERRKESHYLYDRLIELGVPEKKIILEDQSMNTQENIEFAKDVIDDALGLDNVKTIIGMGQIYAGRRYMMTLKKCWPEVLAMQANANPFDAPVEYWHKHPEFAENVMTEWNKLPEYFEKDFIREVDIDALNKQVENVIAAYATGYTFYGSRF